MNRGRRREEIYIDKSDYIAFIELLHEASEVFNVEGGHPSFIAHMRKIYPEMKWYGFNKARYI